MSAFGIDVDEKSVCIFPEGTTREQALDRLVDAVASTGAIADAQLLRTALLAREEVMSTGIGGGVGIPHVRIDTVLRPVLGVGISRTGIDFRAVDNAPVNVLILFAMPPDSNKLYLGLLAQVMVALKMPNFHDRLLGSKTPADVVAVLNEAGG